MSVGLTEEGALIKGIGAYEAGQERGSLFRLNEDIANKQAASEFAAGAYNANAVGMRAKAIEGQQVATIGASNLTQAGTPAQVVAGTAAINEMDRLQVLNNAARKAWGFEVQGESDRLQAGFARRAGTNEALGTILGGSAKAYTELQNGGTWF